jgi:hypothetical protein
LIPRSFSKKVLNIKDMVRFYDPSMADFDARLR